MKRSDLPGLRNFGLWLALLVASGTAGALAWGSWWALPAFFAYGTLYCSSDARWHDCAHGTPFRSRSRGLQKEFEAIIAVVVGGTLLTGGSAIGASFGALIFGTVQMGIFYTGIDTDWFKLFLGVMVLIAVLFNEYIRRKVTEAR
jgi:ABC-type glucose/galactose transport system permease subunit